MAREVIREAMGHLTRGVQGEICIACEARGGACSVEARWGRESGGVTRVLQGGALFATWGRGIVGTL